MVPIRAMPPAILQDLVGIRISTNALPKLFKQMLKTMSLKIMEIATLPILCLILRNNPAKRLRHGLKR